MKLKRIVRKAARKVRALVVALLGVLGSQTAAGMTQMLAIEPMGQSAAVGATALITVEYDVSDADPTLTGLGLRLHWDSTRLTFNGLVNVLATDQAGIDSACRDDSVSDYDNDPATDCYVSIAWASLSGNWPGSLPQSLLQAQFSSVLGVDQATRVNLSASSTATGYSFEATPAVIYSGDTDSDGDGMTDAYEITNNLNPTLDDALGDKDGDSFTNLEEFHAGTAADNPEEMPSQVPSNAVLGIISILPLLLD